MSDVLEDVFQRYVAFYNSEPSNPTHFVNFAKKQGISGVKYSMARNYLRDRKANPAGIATSPPTSASIAAVSQSQGTASNSQRKDSVSSLDSRGSRASSQASPTLKQPKKKIGRRKASCHEDSDDEDDSARAGANYINFNYQNNNNNNSNNNNANNDDVADDVPTPEQEQGQEQGQEQEEEEAPPAIVLAVDGEPLTADAVQQRVNGLRAKLVNIRFECTDTCNTIKEQFEALRQVLAAKEEEMLAAVAGIAEGNKAKVREDIANYENQESFQANCSDGQFTTLDLNVSDVNSGDFADVVDAAYVLNAQ